MYDLVKVCCDSAFRLFVPPLEINMKSKLIQFTLLIDALGLIVHNTRYSKDLSLLSLIKM